MKKSSTWYSHRMQTEVQVTRWGVVGTPVLLFPTAGGDAEECERFHLIGALGDLLEAGRIKVYSCDSVAGRTWLTGNHTPDHRTWMQNQFDEFVVRELVPLICSDCGFEEPTDENGPEIVAAGASMGAFNALASLCRHPELFRAAICMSGTYDLEKYLDGHVTEAFYLASPLHFVPHLPEDGPILAKLRERFVLLTHGEGRWEDPEESWRVANVLGARGIPNRVDPWGTEWDHDWPTWRNMLPKFLDEIVAPAHESSTPDRS